MLATSRLIGGRPGRPCHSQGLAGTWSRSRSTFLEEDANFWGHRLSPPSPDFTCASCCTSSDTSVCGLALLLQIEIDVQGISDEITGDSARFGRTASEFSSLGRTTWQAPAGRVLLRFMSQGACLLVLVDFIGLSIRCTWHVSSDSSWGIALRGCKPHYCQVLVTICSLYRTYNYSGLALLDTREFSQGPHTQFAAGSALQFIFTLAALALSQREMRTGL
mmetsp:Transcript_85760/g.276789  ORF Transcript_85760/g.276789 Transcript_85760/m.276789 type:complete len:220 (-) Transcript_85760:6-665(-)